MSYKLSDFSEFKPIPGPWPTDSDLADFVDNFDQFNEAGLCAILAAVREQTARACIALAGDEGAKFRIRLAYGIPRPYQKCPRCHKELDHHGKCDCS